MKKRCPKCGYSGAQDSCEKEPVIRATISLKDSIARIGKFKARTFPTFSAYIAKLIEQDNE